MEDSKELFWGLGRTWFVALVIAVMVTVVFLTNKIDSETWVNLLMFALGTGGVKSIAVGVTGKIAGPKKTES